MRIYFDAFLYVANWGTHRLMLRVPRGLVDARVAGQYEIEGAVSVEETANHLIVELASAPEDWEGDWEEGEGWLPSLVPLRDMLLGGDLRPLYLGWLAGVQGLYEEDDAEDFDAPEPPVPPGLGRLTGPLKTLTKFLRIDDDLLRVAAATSAPATAAGEGQGELAPWLRKLPTAEKDALLLSLFDEKAPNPRWELLRRFREARGPDAPGSAGGRAEPSASCWPVAPPAPWNGSARRPNNGPRSKSDRPAPRPWRGKNTWRRSPAGKRICGARRKRWFSPNAPRSTIRPSNCCATCATWRAEAPPRARSRAASTSSATATPLNAASWTVSAVRASELASASRLHL
jgi:hypothetical protein